MYEILTSVDAEKSFSACKQILGWKGMRYEQERSSDDIV
jgi:hypothetical protein